MFFERGFKSTPYEMYKSLGYVNLILHVRFGGPSTTSPKVPKRFSKGSERVPEKVPKNLERA